MTEPSGTPTKTTTLVGGVGYTWWIEGLTFIVTFQAQRTLRLHPEFEQMVWDQTLRLAHENLLMPIGSVMISHEDIEISQALSEGVRMLSVEYGSPVPAQMLVRAEVLLSG